MGGGRRGNSAAASATELAAKVAAEWAATGAHRDPSDPKLDQAVLHPADDTPYASIVGVMVAVSQVGRPLASGRKVERVPAFNVTFAVR